MSSYDNPPLHDLLAGLDAEQRQAAEDLVAAAHVDGVQQQGVRLLQ